MEPSQIQLCQNAAAPFQINPMIHPEDFVFQFLLNHPMFKNFDEAVQGYFSDGSNSARMFKSLLEDICHIGDTDLEILEFASGFGCVTRHLKKCLTTCEITACDIHPAAVSFCEKELGVKTLLSASRPEDLSIEKTFDVVFALSFFSHMPKTSFQRWLFRLIDFLKPGGHLIFTTHGLVSLMHLFPDHALDHEGFFFQRSSEQKDLNTREYGSTVTSPKFVLDKVYGRLDISLVYFKEAFWWTHQDCFIVRRLDKPGNTKTVGGRREKIMGLNRLVRIMKKLHRHRQGSGS